MNYQVSVITTTIIKTSIISGLHGSLQMDCIIFYNMITFVLGIDNINICRKNLYKIGEESQKIYNYY